MSNMETKSCQVWKWKYVRYGSEIMSNMEVDVDEFKNEPYTSIIKKEVIIWMIIIYRELWMML
jgi:hypothetical protein